jgi:hypothetical protein
MLFTTPADIQSVAWEGELEASDISYVAKSPLKIRATIGQLEIWPAADALENEVGKKWVPPLGDAGYWLVRLPCTLQAPAGMGITEAQQTLALSPRNPREQPGAVYAYSLFPDRVEAEQKGELSATLNPELKFGDAVALKAGELGAKIELRKVFPVIQSYGAGEASPFWIFRPHLSRPLDGTQFVYAVLVDRAGADGILANVELTVTVRNEFGIIKYGTPYEARRHTQFIIQ